MTEERDEDGQVARKYRELGAEEPPRALDDAILAAARRAAGAGPARPAARAGFQRWQGPVAAAAVLVLAIAVTLNMQLERPGIQSIESPASRASAPAAAPAVDELKLKADRELSPRAKDAGEAAPAVKQKTEKLAEAQSRLADQAPARQPEPAAAPPPAAAASPSAFAGRSDRSDEARNSASSVTGALARQTEERTARDAEARAPQVGAIQALAKRAEMEAKPAPAPAPAKAAAAPAAAAERAMVDTPERELERIAELRRQDKHDEADKALAEFRKRYPEFKIPNATLERVERR